MKVENSLFNPAGPLSLDSKTSTGGGDFGAVLAGYLARQSQAEEEIAADRARDAAYSRRPEQRGTAEAGALAESRKNTARPRPEKRQARLSENKDVEDPGETKTAETEKPDGAATARKAAGDSETAPEKPTAEGKKDQPAQAAEGNAPASPAAGGAAAETAVTAQCPSGEGSETTGAAADALGQEQAAGAAKALPEAVGPQVKEEVVPPQAGPEQATAAEGSDFPLGGKNCIPEKEAPSWQEVMAETLQAETKMEVSSKKGSVVAEATAPAETKATPAAATAPVEEKALPQAVARPTGPEAAVAGTADQGADAVSQPADQAGAVQKQEMTAGLISTGEVTTLHGRLAQEKAAESAAPPAPQDQTAVAAEAAENSSGSQQDAPTGGSTDRGLSHDRTAAPPARGQETAVQGAKAAESAFRNTLGEVAGASGSFETKAPATAGNLREAAPAQQAARLPGEEALHAKAATPATRVVDMDFVSESKERLKVQLEWSQEGVKGMIVAESAQAKSDLSGNMEDLRRRLEQAGVTVLDLDVAMAGQNRQDGGLVDSGTGDTGTGARGAHGQGGNARAGRPVSDPRLPDVGLKLGASVSWIA